MRAIIIEDKDAKNLLKLLELETFIESVPIFDRGLHDDWESLSKSSRDELRRRMHRKFHYVVCTWLQDQGAEVT